MKTLHALPAALALAFAAASIAAHPIDRSGQPKVGNASYYADFFAGRPMANGEPFDPDANHAASRTLPLGTQARVTNLENGKSAVVEIKDRGPYVKGRIIDLSPSTAAQLDMLEDGVVKVEVEPIDVPERERRVRPGASERDAPGTR